MTIHDFHVPHDAFCFPHKIFHKFCFQFFEGRLYLPGEMKTLHLQNDLRQALLGKIKSKK